MYIQIFQNFMYSKRTIIFWTAPHTYLLFKFVNVAEIIISIHIYTGLHYVRKLFKLIYISMDWFYDGCKSFQYEKSIFSNELTQI